MIMAEMGAFDNVNELTAMAGDLATFVQQAAVDGTAAHEVEIGIWQRILAMGRQATGQFLEMQGDGDIGETIEMPDGEELRRPTRSPVRPKTWSRPCFVNDRPPGRASRPSRSPCTNASGRA